MPQTPYAPNDPRPKRPTPHAPNVHVFDHFKLLTLPGLYVSFSKHEYKIVALKYQFLCAKVQSIFGLAPLTSFGLATALLVACAYLIPRVFIETRD